LENLMAAMANPKRPDKRRHWLSAFINRLRFEGRKQYSNRRL
jgi:hypothetical protein